MCNSYIHCAQNLIYISEKIINLKFKFNVTLILRLSFITKFMYIDAVSNSFV